MKIESNPKIIADTNPQTKKVEKNSSQHSFKQVLTETIQSARPENGQVVLQGRIPELNPLQLRTTENRLERSQIPKKLEQLLDILDQYRMHLENPQISLKEMAPLTEDLTAKLKELEPGLDRLDQKDPLVPILNEALITATLEVKKFENGWYNP
jgi:hypothetical protein